jgi:hypothetical protein
LGVLFEIDTKFFLPCLFYFVQYKKFKTESDDKYIVGGKKQFIKTEKNNCENV